MPLRAVSVFSDTESILDEIRHVPRAVGDEWFVAKDGSNSNDGRDASSPFLTITYALSRMSDGDILYVGAGTYDEAINISLNSVTLMCATGAIFSNTTPGTPVTVSGNYNEIHNAFISQAGQVGMLITGLGCGVYHCCCSGATIGFDIDGAQTFVDCSRSVDHTQTGYDISATKVYLGNCHAIGSGGNTRGFYFSSASATFGLAMQVTAIENLTAGFEFVSGANYNAFLNTVESNNGARLDAGTGNFFGNRHYKMEEQHSEFMYPRSDGEGTAGAAVTVSTDAEDENNGPATTQDYWGEPELIVPMETFDYSYELIALEVFGTTTNKEIQIEVYRSDFATCTDKNGGNDWDEGATALTVADASNFATGDLVLIKSDYKVEIQRVASVAGSVVTVEREASQFGAPNTGLRWDHTTNDSGTEKMCRIKRPENLESLGFELAYSAPTSKDFTRLSFGNRKRLRPNDGIVIRSINATDSTNSTRFDCNVVLTR